MGSLFSRQSPPLLGIDISSSSVKLVELGRDKAGNLVLERCAIEPLERGWITDGNIEKFDEVADALLEEMLADPSIDAISICLPSCTQAARHWLTPYAGWSRKAGRGRKTWL